MATPELDLGFPDVVRAKPIKVIQPVEYQKENQMANFSVKKAFALLGLVIFIGWLGLGLGHHYGYIEKAPPFWMPFFDAPLSGPSPLQEQAFVPLTQQSGITLATEPEVQMNPAMMGTHYRPGLAIGGKRLPKEVADKLCEQTGEGQNIDITPLVGPGYQPINCTLNR